MGILTRRQVVVNITRRFLGSGAKPSREASGQKPVNFPSQESPMKIGDTISHFRILGELGQGATGVVYLAQDTQLDRPVALKALASDVVADEPLRQRFLREARAAASFSHSGI